MVADKNTKKTVKKQLRAKKWMKIKYRLVCVSGRNKARYLKKNRVFAEFGDNVLFQPTLLPNDPEFIKIHNNVKIAAGVSFYAHDVINGIFVELDDCQYRTHLTCIEIMDNVFIGANSIIVGNCKIGPNAIVAAGSVVTKDVPEGTIVGGNPAKVIGSFEKLHQKRLEEDGNQDYVSSSERVKETWEKFYNR